MVYALGRTKGCSKYSKAEHNKTPPLYKYVEGIRDTHMIDCVNRLRNHDGLKIAETTLNETSAAKMQRFATNPVSL